MRNRSPRSFTVETKSGGRHQRTFIPHRATAAATPRPAVSWPPPAESQAPTAEPRRILPNLIVPEPAQDKPGPAQVPEVCSPKPRRGRPPKAKPIVEEVAEEPIVEPAIEIAAGVPPPVPEASEARPARSTRPMPALPLGERWKRRLGRWAQ